MASNYVYPHIEFTQSTVGTIPQTSTWRSTIGVVGQFRRGPLLYKITGSQDFNRLYGADSSSGAKAVRQMLALGATDILISRAVSQQTASIKAISFYGLTPGVTPKIGYEGQVQQYHNGSPVATTGIGVDFNYIGEALSSLNSFGTIKVNPSSRLNRDLVYTGQSTLSLTVEERITNSIALSLTAALNGSTAAYLATTALTFNLSSSGTIASLNTSLTPQGGASVLATADMLATPDGGLITLGAVNYTVTQAGSLAIGQTALKATAVNVTNVLARLDAGSKLYFNNAEIGTVVSSVNPTNLPITIYAITNSIVPIPATSTLEAQAVIGLGMVTLKPAATDGYQFLKISRNNYQAVVSNLTPGRILHSNDSNLTLGQGYLTVLSEPIVDPLDNTTYKVLVKGSVAGTVTDLAAGVKVSLYEAVVNGYVIGVSTTAQLSSINYPNAVQWRNQLYNRNSNLLLDSYEIVTEAYATTNLKVTFLFIEADDTVRAVDSGIVFDLPSIVNSGAVAFLSGSTFTIPLVRATILTGSLLPSGTAFAIGTSAGDVLKEIDSQIIQNSLLSSLLAIPIVSSTLHPATLSLTSQIKGVQANRIYTEIFRQTIGEDLVTGTYANDLLLNTSDVGVAYTNWTTLPSAVTPSYSPTYFTLGNQGATAASLNLYSATSDLLVNIVALSSGAYGNQLQVSVNPGVNGQFIVNITDLDSSSYQNTPTSETLNLSTRDVDLNTGIFNATANSGMIRAYYVPIIKTTAPLTDLELDQVPVRIAPAFGAIVPSLDYVTTTGTPSPYSPAYQGLSYLQGLYLQGGGDAALEPDADSSKVGAAAMIRAVQALEAADIAFLIPTGIVIGDARYGGVVEECIGQVNRTAGLNSNRRLIIQAPPNLNQSQAVLYGAQLNNKDITLVAGTCAFVGLSNSNTEHTAPLYAATLSLSSPQHSPAYIGNGVPINGVISVDTLATPQYLDALTRAGVDALYYDTGLAQFKFLNGRTTSRNSQQQQVSIRRVSLQMIADLYTTALGLESAQNDEQTRVLVASSFDAYLNSKISAGWIQAVSPTICNASNNPLSTQVQNKLNVLVSYTPYFPADIILVNVVQNFSVSVG